MNTENKNNNCVLVTEGNSFLGLHLIALLLRKGYTVRATLPPLCFKRDVLNCLSTLGIPADAPLSFIKASSNGQYNWDKAISGCQYLMYNSSSNFTGKSKNKFSIVAPSSQGIREIFDCLKGHCVERIVLSAYAASGIETHSVFQPSMAERTARQLIHKSNLDVALTVINSGGVFGPRISRCCSDWIDLIKNIISGGVKQSPDYAFGVVDVRDLAELHVLALSHPGALNECFAACSDGQYTVYDIAQLITSYRPHFSASISALQPNPAHQSWNASNEKAKKVLGWIPKSKEEAILASVDSIFS